MNDTLKQCADSLANISRRLDSLEEKRKQQREISRKYITAKPPKNMERPLSWLDPEERKWRLPLETHLVHGLTGKKTSPEYQNTQEWLRRERAERERGQEELKQLSKMTSEELRDTPEWREYLVRQALKKHFP